MKKLAITVNGKRYEVDVEVLQDDETIASTPPFRPPVRMRDTAGPVGGSPSVVASTPKPKVTIGSSKTLTSPINGVVLDVPATVGQKVKENDVLIVVEAMKMKTNIASPQKGKIATVNVKVGDTIESGQVLLTYE